jgi:hypothetical protein
MLTNQQIKGFLYAVEGVGVILIALFAIVYLAGLPTDLVYHSQPIFRTPLSIIGTVLIALALAAMAIAFLTKRTQP